MNYQRLVSIFPNTPIQSCPNCYRHHFALFAEYEHFEINLKYDICRYCGLVFMNPQFQEGDLTDFYREEYRQKYSGQIDPTADEKKEQNARASHLSSFLSSKINTVSSHLDIGCSTGELIKYIRDELSPMLSIGVEPSDAHRKWCQKHDITAYHSLNAMPKDFGRFDLVTLIHVLEHIPDPIEYLKNLRSEILAPDGYLVLEVPNLLGHISFEVAHLTCFYEKTLLDALHQAGYTAQTVKIHGIPRRYKNSKRYITVIARPQNNIDRLPSIRRVWWYQVQLMRSKGMVKRGWTGYFGSQIYQTVRRIGIY